MPTNPSFARALWRGTASGQRPPPAAFGPSPGLITTPALSGLRRPALPLDIRAAFWYGVVGKGEPPCDGHCDDEVLGTRLQRARDDADPRDRAGLSGLEPDGAGAHGVRAVAVAARERAAEGPRVPRVPGAASTRRERWRCRTSAWAAPPARSPACPGRRRESRVARWWAACADIEPLSVEPVRAPAERLLFRELVGRYHYLGHAVPFGAHLRYLVFRVEASAGGGRLPAVLQPGVAGWRRGTAGSAGTTRLGRGISSTWSTTAASCCCRGSG